MERGAEARWREARVGGDLAKASYAGEAHTRSVPERGSSAGVDGALHCTRQVRIL